MFGRRCAVMRRSHQRPALSERGDDRVQLLRVQSHALCEEIDPQARRIAAHLNIHLERHRQLPSIS